MPPTSRLAVAGLALLAVTTSGALAQETPPATPPPAELSAPAPLPASADPGAVELQRAKEAFKQGTWQDAREAAAKVLEASPKNLEALYIAGASERQTNRLAEAAEHLKTLVDVSPIFPLAHFQLGYVLFLQAEGLTREGQVEPAKGRYVESAGEFGKELARNPTHAPSLSSRAIALSRGGQIDESVQAHDAWITAVPQKNDPVVSLVATVAGAGRSSEAMAALDRLPDKSVKAVFDATSAAAGVFISRRDWSAAVPFLEKAADTDPASTRARALLTESCARAGLVDDTVRSLRTLLTMDATPDEAESVGEAITATLGDGKKPSTSAAVQPPMIIRLPSPKHPKGQDTTVETAVLVLALVRQDGTVADTVMVPNRIWKDIRATGFEAAAFDAVKRGKFAAGTKDGQPAELWIVVLVKFTKQ